MNISFRKATDSDYWFAFELKKAAEFEPIKAVFGWDDELQKEMHAEEWANGKPTLICLDNKAIGSYLVEYSPGHIYFCRFFLLPEYHGKGIGSAVLRNVVSNSDELQMVCKLSHLQGNRVGSLYERFGFKVTDQNEQFVYMTREPICL